MDEIGPQPEVDERLADLRRRRVEAADVLAETLLDVYLRGRQAKRAGGLLSCKVLHVFAISRPNFLHFYFGCPS